MCSWDFLKWTKMPRIHSTPWAALGLSNEAQVYTILEICGALDSQSKAKQDFIDNSRNRAPIQQKRTSGHGFQAVKQAPGAGYQVNDVIEITVSVQSAHLTLTYQTNWKDNKKNTAVIILCLHRQTKLFCQMQLSIVLIPVIYMDSSLWMMPVLSSTLRFRFRLKAN